MINYVPVTSTGRQLRITFVHSPEDYYDQNYGTQFIPLWAYYLASFTPAGWERKIVDCRLQDLSKVGPAEVFAFGGINQDLGSMTRSWQYLKDKYPHATFLLGGPITWSFQKEDKLDLLRHFDYLFILDGEKTLPTFLEAYANGRHQREFEPIIESPRYPIGDARRVAFDLMDNQTYNYYGAVVEVSRGCPFLCEFCDIRVVPGNNKSNVKDIALIIEELDEYYKRGITKFQFACDNFIGDVNWAHACLDAILEWKKRTGARISLFTWLTINLYKMPEMMRKLRECGFSVIFIGIESVNQNSLLETAKVQNMNALQEAVETIHSYGFIIAPGFIFGFDSDTETVFEDTLEFMEQTGVIGGDPSFLTALAGTPLYDRMRKTGRLIERDGAIERKKIQTNIQYLQDAEFLSRGFLEFLDGFDDGEFQYRRLKRHLDLMLESDTFISTRDTGYASPWHYIIKQVRNLGYMTMLWRRIKFALTPRRLRWIWKSYWMTKRAERKCPGVTTNFFYWLYVWSNMKLKYDGLKLEDFGLTSVGEEFDVEAALAASEYNESEREQMLRDGIKIQAQSKFTKQALETLAATRKKRKEMASDGELESEELQKAAV